MQRQQLQLIPRPLQSLTQSKPENSGYEIGQMALSCFRTTGHMALIPSSQWNSHSLTRSLLQMYLGSQESGPSPSWVYFGECLYGRKKKTVDFFFETNLTAPAILCSGCFTLTELTGLSSRQPRLSKCLYGENQWKYDPAWRLPYTNEKGLPL